MKILRTAEDIVGYDYSWFILNQSIIKKEFALSGSEQNPDITNRNLKLLLKSRLSGGAPGPVEAFKQWGEDFIVVDTLEELVRGMNKLTGDNLLDFDEINIKSENLQFWLTQELEPGRPSSTFTK